jgi:hypothetical protein
VVASAWGRQLVLQGVDMVALVDFIEAFAGSAELPHPDDECALGTDLIDR